MATMVTHMYLGECKIIILFLAIISMILSFLRIQPTYGTPSKKAQKIKKEKSVWLIDIAAKTMGILFIGIIFQRFPSIYFCVMFTMIFLIMPIYLGIIRMVLFGQSQKDDALILATITSVLAIAFWAVPVNFYSNTFACLLRSNDVVNEIAVITVYVLYYYFFIFWCMAMILLVAKLYVAPITTKINALAVKIDSYINCEFKKNDDFTYKHLTYSCKNSILCFINKFTWGLYDLLALEVFLLKRVFKYLFIGCGMIFTFTVPLIKDIFLTPIQSREAQSLYIVSIQWAAIFSIIVSNILITYNSLVSPAAVSTFGFASSVLIIPIILSHMISKKTVSNNDKAVACK